MAGIKTRYGFGFGHQKYILTEKPFLDPLTRHHHTIDHLKNLLDLHQIPYDPHNYNLVFPQHLTKQVHEELKNLKQPFIALGIGGSETTRHWKLDNFVNLVLKLNHMGFSSILICGGPQDSQEAAYIVHHVKNAGGTAISATHYPIDFSLALMKECHVYIGNDTSLLNGAACGETLTLGLFGTEPPLTYSPFIHGVQGQGMDSISVEKVLHSFKALMDDNKLKWT